MLVIVGYIIVLASVLGGFAIAGGHVEALIHPSELLVIGGAALGAMIVASPIKVLKDLAAACLTAVKGSPYARQAYDELFMCMYDLLRLARRDGMRVLEAHVAEPENSDIFKKYPAVADNLRVRDFICGAMAPLIESTAKPDQLAELLDIEIKVLEEEHHAPMHALQKTAEALPGFGIVAAVLGIVITMGHIDGPPSEIGHKVGAALVGTFLGILLSYGFAAPLATRLEAMGVHETAFFRTIAAIIVGFADNLPPKVAVDLARRGVANEFRPNRAELDELFKQADAA